MIPLLANMALKRYNLAVPEQGGRSRPARPTSRATWKRSTANGTDGILLAITGQDAINFIQNYISSGKTRREVRADHHRRRRRAQGDQGPEASTSTGRRATTAGNKQYLADMKAAGYKNPVGQEIVSYAAVMAVAQAAEGPYRRSTRRRSTPSCRRSPTSTSASILPIVDFTQGRNGRSRSQRATRSRTCA